MCQSADNSTHDVTCDEAPSKQVKLPTATASERESCPYLWQDESTPVVFTCECFHGSNQFLKGGGVGGESRVSQMLCSPAASDTGRQLEQSAKKRCRREVRNGLT